MGAGRFRGGWEASDLPKKIVNIKDVMIYIKIKLKFDTHVRDHIFQPEKMCPTAPKPPRRLRNRPALLVTYAGQRGAVAPRAPVPQSWEKISTQKIFKHHVCCRGSHRRTARASVGGYPGHRPRAAPELFPPAACLRQHGVEVAPRGQPHCGTSRRSSTSPTPWRALDLPFLKPAWRMIALSRRQQPEARIAACWRRRAPPWAMPVK